jgi:molecular chaperone GrpE
MTFKQRKNAGVKMRDTEEPENSEVRTQQGQVEGCGGAAAPSSESADLEAKLAEKEQELAELKDKYLRALADSENARKRIRQQSEESVRLQRENLLREILPIVDNLERAVEAARGGGNGQPIVEGVEMVLRSLIDLLRGQGVTPLTAVGQLFDPQRHEAVDQVANSAHPPNTVVAEFHRGYVIGERMLRPARVSVAVALRDPGGGAKDGSD